MPDVRKAEKAGRMAKRDRARLLARFKQEMVNHPRLKAVRKQVRELFEDDDPASIVIIAGPGGVGKTSLLESLRREFGEQCLFLEARSANGRAYDNREHCRLLLEQLGDPAPDDHFDPDEAAARRRRGYRRPAVGRRATLSDLRIALERALPATGIECVLIDEAQHMFNAATGFRLQQQMDLIKSMSNISGVRHVLAGSTELLTLLELTPQLHRRCRVVRFTAYRHDSQKDRSQFLATFRALVQRIPLPEQGKLAAEFEYVLANSAGSVGPLKDWLRRALARALRKGLPSIDSKVLRETVLEPGAVQSMADEAGLCAGVAGGHLAETGSAAGPAGKDGPGRKHHRVQRKPAIDPVGPVHEAA